MVPTGGEADPYLPRVRKLSLQADPSHCLPPREEPSAKKDSFLLQRAACRLHHERFVTCFVTPAPAFREGAQPLRTRRSARREQEDDAADIAADDFLRAPPSDPKRFMAIC